MLFRIYACIINHAWFTNIDNNHFRRVVCAITESHRPAKHSTSRNLCFMFKNSKLSLECDGGKCYSLHSLFEAQCKELAEAIDEIAERIRAIGSKGKPILHILIRINQLLIRTYQALLRSC